MNSTRNSALEYLRAGFSVIPVRCDGSKAAAVKWREYQQRYPTEAELETWFNNGADRGIAVVAGQISNNLLILDFDEEAEIYFPKWWDDAQRQVPGIAQQIVVCGTPRPGTQVWMRSASAPLGNQVLAFTEPQPNGEINEDGQPVRVPKAMIETRAEGGYVVAVGSPAAVHANNSPYQLLHGQFDKLPTIPDSDVEVLLAICRSYSRFTPQRVEQERQERSGEPLPGDIFNRHKPWNELLSEASWRLCRADGEVEYWTRPGKDPAAGHSATLGMVRTSTGAPSLYVFSSAAQPWQSETQYDQFGFLTTWKHGGDFSAAAAELRDVYAAEYQQAQREYHQPYPDEHPDSFLEYQPFPIEVLPELLRDYVIEQSRSIGVDSAMVAAPLLSSLAGLIGQSRQVFLRDTWTQPAILWTCVICGVSEGKTPAMDAGANPADKVQQQLRRNNQDLIREYKRQIQAWEQDKKNNTKPQKPPLAQLTIGNFTLEVIARRLEANWKGLLLRKTELAGWVKSFNQYRSGGDNETWLEFWDGKFENVDRVTNDVHIEGGPCTISVTGTVQPNVVRKVLLAEQFIDNGLAARILFCHPTNPFIPDDGSCKTDEESALLARMQELGRHLWALAGEKNALGESVPVVLPLDETARELFFQFKNYTKQQSRLLPEGALAGAISKMDSQAARIALVLSCCRQLSEFPDAQATGAVSGADMEAALTIAEWFSGEARRLYSDLDQSGEQQQMRAVLDYMRRTGKTEIRPHELARNIRTIATAQIAEALLKNMVSAGLGTGEITSPSTGGRPGWVFKIIS